MRRRPKNYSKDLIDKMKTQYESGRDLIDISIEFSVNYGTLKNIASKQSWNKGILSKMIIAKEQVDLIENNICNRAKVKEKYRALTDKLRELLLEKAETIEGLSKEQALNMRAQTLHELYAMDKELYSILTDKEMIELKGTMLKFEQLKAVIEGTAEVKELL